LGPERLQVLRPEVRQVWDRPLAMVRRVEEVRGHPEHPWVLLMPVSVRLVRRGRGLHRQVLVRRQALLGLRGRGQILREPEKLLGRV
jgi:hypothetical protein